MVYTYITQKYTIIMIIMSLDYLFDKHKKRKHQHPTHPKKNTPVTVHFIVFRIIIDFKWTHRSWTRYGSSTATASSMRQSRRARISTEAWARLPSLDLQLLSMAYTYKLLHAHAIIAIDIRGNVLKSALTVRN